MNDATKDREFRSLFELHYPQVEAYARRRCARSADADDVVAETFTVAWRRFQDIPAEPLPWLYGVARRVLANQRRGQRRWAGLLDRLRREPMDVATPHDTGEPVRVALSRLKPADQELLRLAAWEDLGPSEIAATLGISANAASIRLHRARKQLAAELTALGLAPRKNEASAGHLVG
ncbi:MAG: sigma-70 family RNA polymerase sigma factor [Dehalococcoidia bacterium]